MRPIREHMVYSNVGFVPNRLKPGIPIPGGKSLRQIILAPWYSANLSLRHLETVITTTKIKKSRETITTRSNIRTRVGRSTCEQTPLYVLCPLAIIWILA